MNQIRFENYMVQLGEGLATDRALPALKARLGIALATLREDVHGAGCPCAGCYGATAMVALWERAQTQGADLGDEREYRALELAFNAARMSLQAGGPDWLSGARTVGTLAADAKALLDEVAA